MDGKRFDGSRKTRDPPYPVIMLTGHELTPRDVENYGICIEDFLQKPVTSGELSDAITHVFAREQRIKEEIAAAKDAGIDMDELCECARLARVVDVNKRLWNVLVSTYGREAVLHGPESDIPLAIKNTKRKIQDQEYRLKQIWRKLVPVQKGENILYLKKTAELSRILFFTYSVKKRSGLNQILQQPGRFNGSPVTMGVCPDSGMAYTTGKNHIRGGVKRPMTDNLKVKASKAVDDARVAAHAAYDDAGVAVHNTLKGAGEAANKASDDAKIGVHKAVADAKITVHEAGSKLKKEH